MSGGSFGAGVCAAATAAPAIASEIANTILSFMPSPLPFILAFPGRLRIQWLPRRINRCCHWVGGLFHLDYCRWHSVSGPGPLPEAKEKLHGLCDCRTLHQHQGHGMR